MNKWLLAGLLVLQGTNCVSADDDSASFKYVRDIQTSPRTREELVAVPLDSEVYGETTDHLADVRILDAADHFVPYLLRKQVETKPYKTRRTWPTRDVALRPLEKEGLEIRVSLRDDERNRDPQPTGIRILSPLRNYEQRVQVFGIDETGAEQTLVSDGLIFDYSQYMDVNHNEIPLPETTHRKFRIVIEQVTSDQESQLLELTRRLRGGAEEERNERMTIQRRPFRIDHIGFLLDETQQGIVREKVRSYDVKQFQMEADEEHKQTVIHITTRREPLVAFSLKTSSRNFSRRAVVQIPELRGGRTVWRDIGSTALTRFQFRDLDKESLRVEFPEIRRDEFRILIDNGDSPPLDVQEVHSEGAAYELVLLAAAEGDYRLLYGFESVEPPNYDTAALKAILGKGDISVEGSLGPARTQDVQKQLDLHGFLNHPLFLGGVIVALVLLLAWALYRASQRIERLPSDEP